MCIIFQLILFAKIFSKSHFSLLIPDSTLDENQWVIFDNLPFVHFVSQ